MSSRSKLIAWLVTLAALVVFYAGRGIIIPLVDPMALEEAFYGVPSVQPTLVAVFGVGLGWLLVVWLVRGLTKDDVPYRLTVIAYLGVCALTSFFTAATIQSSDIMLVATPGPKFVLLATLTQTAGAAFLWLLAEWITRRGVGCLHSVHTPASVRPCR